AWTTFRRVTLPLLSPASLFLAVWLTINALQLFDEVYLSTQGGPLHATTVLVYYLYDQAFVNFNFGYASAIAYVLFLIILVVTAIQFRVGRRFTHYRSSAPRPRRSPRHRPAASAAGPPPRWRPPFSPWPLVLTPAPIVLIFRFFWLLTPSVESPSEALHFPPVLVPRHIHLGNYKAAWQAAPFGRFFLNSSIVA